jgi:isoquinoline 1-oxidoreductase beta subunit
MHDPAIQGARQRATQAATPGVVQDTMLARRRFLVSAAAATGGLVLGFHLPTDARQARAAETAPATHDGATHAPTTDDGATQAGSEVNAWVVIRPDETVIIRVARAEMGQGIFTALPMLVAEDLDCDWRHVRAEYASANRNYREHSFGSMLTGGSLSVRSSQDYLRTAGATARAMLIEAAAAQWQVPPAECTAANGIITHAPTHRTVSYGKVADAAAKLTPPRDVKLKPVSAWRLIGTPVKRLDTPEKVHARPVYGIDVRLPGMVYATVANCPVFGGKLKSYDEPKIKGMKGVQQVVPLGNAVAVVGDGYWQVRHALDSLPVTWDDGGNGGVDSAAIAQLIRGGLTGTDAAVLRSDGDVAGVTAAAHTVVEAEYAAPFLAHAAMEPTNCTAQVTADRVEVWVPTQNADATLLLAAKAAGVDPSQVEVHVTMLGGGFGRRGAAVAQNFVPQAVAIARAVGKPVKLLWSREEDVRCDFYRPTSVAKFTAGLDEAGGLLGWHLRLAGPSIAHTLAPATIAHGADARMLEGLIDMPYAVQNILIDYAMRNTHVPVGFWRSVNHSQNAFFKESFVDEMAHATGQDPYQFRRTLLAHNPLHLAVLDAAAKRAGWGDKLPAGVFRGIAHNEAYGTIVTQVVEASVSSKGEVTVHRVVCAMDPGHVVNPDTIEAQIQGAIVFGLTAALYGEITIKQGRVEQGNFDDYEMVRLADMPKVEVVLVPSGATWGGVGEPGLPPLAPALCNALFAATGKRIRSLPIKDQNLTAA